MLNTYQQWNRTSARWLWIVVLVAVLAALPMNFGRLQTETTEGTDQVEFVFDYRDLVELSTYRSHPEEYRREQLSRMKELGIGSMAVYESTLEELRNSGRIQLFTQQEALLLTGAGAASAVQPGRNRTYLLFADAATGKELEPLLRDTFQKRLEVGMQPWSLDGRSGYILDIAYEDALMKPMFPDPIAIQQLRDSGFQIVARLSNRMQPFSVERVEAMLAYLQSQGVKRILFDGTEVTGYSDSPADREQLPQVAALLNKNGIGLAAIELLKAPQKGFNTLANQTDYNVVRLTSIQEAEVARLTPDKLSERIVLAVKDRNIRMVFFNSRAGKDTDKAVINDYLEDTLYKALEGPDGAVRKLENAGFKLGLAQPFVEHDVPMSKLLKVIVMIGVVALGALLIGEFIGILRLAAFVVGMGGAAALTVLSAPVALQAMALAAGISAPTLAVIRIVRWTEERRAAGAGGGALVSLWKLLQALALTFVGIVFMVGLLDHIQYSLQLQQYRGVSLHHAVPIALVALYVLAFREKLLGAAFNRLKELLTLRISVWMVIAGAVAAAAGWYYLSRTGNSGQASAFELLFRSLLEEKLGARPRFKELMGHPALILGVFLALRYRWGALLLIAGVVGQLSVSGTFAHFHTPLAISLLRVFNGAWIGAIIGLALIAVWTLGRRSWLRWAAK
ncbi:DUF5693 family protein [Paenibacillus thermoaerophilus]